MAFGKYRQTRRWAKAIRQAVIERTMPPWHADAETSRRIRNSRALTWLEIETIVKWVDQGAVEGAAVEAVAVPAQGTVQYAFLLTPVNFTEDRWIAAEGPPGASIRTMKEEKITW